MRRPRHPIVSIITLNSRIERIGAVVGEHFGRHRDAEIYTSLPGLGYILGARILGEFGDDPDRYPDARARKNYAEIRYRGAALI